MAQSNKKPSISKPKKPHPDFPLYSHASGRWAKKVRGKTLFFGPWNDPQAALEKWLDEKDDLLAGRTPRPKTTDGLLIRHLCDVFKKSKDRLLQSGDISPRTYGDCIRTCRVIVDYFGRDRLVEDLIQDDFEQFRVELAKTRNPVSLSDIIGRVRSVFKYGDDAGLIDRPVRFGSGFAKPSRKKIREVENESDPRMFGKAELLVLLEQADPIMKSMILLGINCGFGQSDIANLPQNVFDWKSGFVDFPRPKTAIKRRCSLWSETIQAVQEAIEKRPTPKDEKDDGLCFLTRYGERWVRPSKGKQKAWVDSVGLQFGKLLRKHDLKRPGLNFYALRHTLETIAGESIDQVVVNSIMGHVDNSMAAKYRHHISDERYKAVADHVHSWLFSKKK